uniref:Uncharacterized protein n=1 Tax=viral metagenome TaxID=1070528 RepID=A0A6C0HVP3_9ZZZZ
MSDDIERATQAIEANRDKPNVVVMLSMDKCIFCDKTAELISKTPKYSLVTVKIADPKAFGVTFATNPLYTKKSGQFTFPVNFLQGKMIGGFDDISAYIQSNPEPSPKPPPSSKPPPSKPPSSSSKPPPSSKPPINIPKGVPATGQSNRRKSLDEGLLPQGTGLFRERDLNFAPIAASINTNVDPLFSDLKRCLCDGFAEIFTSTSPLIIHRIVETLKDTIDDPIVREHIDSRIIQLITEIKNAPELDMILSNLDGECKEVFSVTK